MEKGIYVVLLSCLTMAIGRCARDNIDTSIEMKLAKRMTRSLFDGRNECMNSHTNAAGKVTMAGIHSHYV